MVVEGAGTARGLTIPVVPMEYVSHGLPIKSLPTGREHLVSQYLRELVMAIEHGELLADSVMVLLTLDGQTFPYFTGYDDYTDLHDAAHDGNSAAWAFRSGQQWDAVKVAKQRRVLAQMRRRDHEKALLAKPYVCYCKERYATIGGFRQHMRIATRGADHGITSGYYHHISVGKEGAEYHAGVSQTYLDELGQRWQELYGLHCELHGLMEVYEGKRKVPAGWLQT